MIEFKRFVDVVITLLFVGAIIWMVDDAATNGDDFSKEQRLYCEMVQIHKESNGHYGWPDFRANANEVCK